MRKKPGRPKKQELQENEKQYIGIVNNSINNSNSLIEMELACPMNFKKIINVYKLYDTRDIKFEFKKTEMILSGSNTYDDAILIVKFNCHKIKRYFCKNSITIHIGTDLLDKVMKNIDKNILLLSMQIDDHTKDSIVTIVLKNHKIKKEIKYNLNITPTAKLIKSHNNNIFRDNIFSFCLPFDQIKKILNESLLPQKIMITIDKIKKIILFRSTSEVSGELETLIKYNYEYYNANIKNINAESCTNTIKVSTLKPFSSLKFHNYNVQFIGNDKTIVLHLDDKDKKFIIDLYISLPTN